MGLAFAMLTLRNPRYPELPPVEVEALADTGSTFLCVPAAVAEALRLETYATKTRPSLTAADGECPTWGRWRCASRTELHLAER